ncbi:MAG: helix-turn-helix domain-containing protein [Pedobacter sp.]
MDKWSPEDIQSFRKSAGLTQAQLAERLGVSQNYVYMLEKGVKKPSTTLQLLMDYIAKDLTNEPVIGKGDTSGTNSDSGGLQKT